MTFVVIYLQRGAQRNAAPLGPFKARDAFELLLSPLMTFWDCYHVKNRGAIMVYYYLYLR